MKYIIQFFPAGIFLTLSFLMTGCTNTVITTKNPVFTVGRDTMKTELSNLFTSENLIVEGRSINTNGKISSEMEIEIINGKNISDVQDQLDSLAKSIAVYFINALKDKNEYDRYRVIFVKVKVKDGVTIRTLKGHEFKKSEL